MGLVWERWIGFRRGREEKGEEEARFSEGGLLDFFIREEWAAVNLKLIAVALRVDGGVVRRKRVSELEFGSLHMTTPKRFRYRLSIDLSPIYGCFTTQPSRLAASLSVLKVC